MKKESLRTKIIWGLSMCSFEKSSADDIAKTLITGPQHAVRAVYTPSMHQHLNKLRASLNAQSQSVPLKFSQSEGWLPFVISLAGRRAVLKTPDRLCAVQREEEFELPFRVSFSDCVEKEFDPSQVAHREVVVSHWDMLKDLKSGVKLSFSYGQVEATITSIKKTSPNEIVTVVKIDSGDSLMNGMHVFSKALPSQLFPLIENDKLALENKLGGISDYILIHGINNAEEVQELKRFILGSGAASSKRHPTVGISALVKDKSAPIPPKFIFKVDSEVALSLLDEVLPLVDGVFLSRSELGLYVNVFTLPSLQKEIIAKCNQAGKLIIVASELMFSMRTNSTPTRAEVSDLANIVADGADAVMLSEEVVEGPFSKEAAEVTFDTIQNCSGMLEANWHRVPFEIHNEEDALAAGAIEIAKNTNARAIVCLTEGGYTAQRLSSFKTPIDIIAITYNRNVMRQLNIIGSVNAMVLDKHPPFDQVLHETKAMLVKYCGFEAKDKIVYVSLTASPVSARNSNLFTLQEIGS